MRCQNVTRSSSKAEASSAVTISQIVGVWIAVVIVALAVIALAAAVVYCLRKHGCVTYSITLFVVNFVIDV